MSPLKYILYYNIVQFCCCRKKVCIEMNLIFQRRSLCVGLVFVAAAWGLQSKIIITNSETFVNQFCKKSEVSKFISDFCLNDKHSFHMALLVRHVHIWQVLTDMKTQCIIKPARSAGFLRIKKIPYQAPSDSIGAPKMYILEKRIFGNQISMLGFFWKI